MRDDSGRRCGTACPLNHTTRQTEEMRPKKEPANLLDGRREVCARLTERVHTNAVGIVCVHTSVDMGDDSGRHSRTDGHARWKGRSVVYMQYYPNATSSLFSLTEYL